MGVRFPTPELIEQLKSADKFEETLDIFADIIAASISSSPPDPDADLCRSCLRAATQDEMVRRHSKLRRSLFKAIYDMRAVVDSSVETVWDTVSVFGPTNSKRTEAYLERLPRGVPIKLAKLVLARANDTLSDSTLPDNLQSVIACFFLSRRFADELEASMGQFRQLKNRSTLARTVVEVENARESMRSVSDLQSLFPQLSVSQAKALLHSSEGNLEQATQKLLDNPNYFEEVKAPKPKAFVHLAPKEERQSTRNVDPALYEKTLSLALASMEDEDPDDSLDQPFETLSAADQKLWKQDEILYKAWKRQPNLFDRQSRKASERTKLAAQLSWTNEQIEGWANTLSKDPRRQAALDWRYTMGKAVVGRPTPKLEDSREDSDDEENAIARTTKTPEPPTSSTDSSNDGGKRNHHKDQRKDIRRDRQRNQKRDQKHAKQAGPTP